MEEFQQYNIFKEPSDYSILQDSIDRLHFIQGVSIYYDKTKTKRSVFDVYASFDAWLDASIKQYSLPFFPLIEFVRTLVSTIQTRLLQPFESNKVFLIPDELKANLERLLKEGQPYDEYDSYTAFLRSIVHYMSLENNYSIVCNDGTFLMSKSNIGPPWFYHAITLSPQGLFECEKRWMHVNGPTLLEGHVYDPASILYSTGSIHTFSNKYIWDHTGRYIEAKDFESSCKVLANCTDDFLTLLAQRPNYNFNIGKGEYYEYRTIFEGKEEVAWDKRLPNGLMYYCETRTVRGSDYRYFADPFVCDAAGNTVEVYAFYQSLEMLRNGRIYLQVLIEDSIKRQVERCR